MSEGVVLSKKFLTKFIEIYKEHPALWKVKSREYSNKNLKTRAYNALIEYCKQYYPDADRNFVSKKIQNIRGCFRKELKKVEASQLSGTGADDVYEPHLWYFDLLLFTTDQEMPVESVDSESYEDERQCTELTTDTNIEVEEGENLTDGTEDFLGSNSQVDETDTIAEESQDVPSTSKKGFKKPTQQVQFRTTGNNSRKRKCSQQQQQEFMKTCTEVLQQKERVDEFDAIGINVASKLRKMVPSQQILAEGLINRVLTKGIFNELTRTTDISNSFVNYSYLCDQSSYSATVTSSPLTLPTPNSSI